MIHGKAVNVISPKVLMLLVIFLVLVGCASPHAKDLIRRDCDQVPGWISLGSISVDAYTGSVLLETNAHGVRLIIVIQKPEWGGEYFGFPSAPLIAASRFKAWALNEDETVLELVDRSKGDLAEPALSGIASAQADFVFQNPSTQTRVIGAVVCVDGRFYAFRVQ